MGWQFRACRITEVSNSHSQRDYIETEAAKRGLNNLRVMTADMNVFAPDAPFDRIVSVQMFEHMLNWRELLTRGDSWLGPGGRLFMHIVTHPAAPYLLAP